MPSNGLSHPPRTALRHAVTGEVFVDVLLCGNTVCRARIVDQQGGSLGLVLGGDDALRALEHRECCGRVRLRVVGYRVVGEPERRVRDVPAELVHVTAIGDGAKAGVGFRVSCLDPADVEHLLALWERLRQQAAG